MRHRLEDAVEISFGNGERHIDRLDLGYDDKRGGGARLHEIGDIDEPQPAVTTDASSEVQVNVQQAFYALDNKNCSDFKNYIAPALRATMTDADCAAAFANHTDLSHLVYVDWTRSSASADGKTFNVVDSKGNVYMIYVLGDDNIWYLNNKYWETAK